MPDETGLCLIVAVFYYVRLFKRSIVFDWQNFWVSSIKFDYRTQSKSIKRLEIDWVRLTTSAHLTMNQVIGQIKRDIFTKEIIVLILKYMPAHLTYIKRMVQGRFTQRFLKNI